MKRDIAIIESFAKKANRPKEDVEKSTKALKKTAGTVAKNAHDGAGVVRQLRA